MTRRARKVPRLADAAFVLAARTVKLDADPFARCESRLTNKAHSSHARRDMYASAEGDDGRHLCERWGEGGEREGAVALEGPVARSSAFKQDLDAVQPASCCPAPSSPRLCPCFASRR